MMKVSSYDEKDKLVVALKLSNPRRKIVAAIYLTRIGCHQRRSD
jgi:hypothetical protein